MNLQFDKLIFYIVVIISFLFLYSMGCVPPNSEASEAQVDISDEFESGPYRYMVVMSEGRGRVYFEKKVTNYLNKGWQLQGGVHVDLQYAQAMVWIDPEPPPQ